MKVGSGVKHQRKLAGNQMKKAHLLFGVCARAHTAQAEHSQPARSPGQRKGASGDDTQVFEKFPMLRKTLFLLPVGGYERLLRFMHPVYWRIPKETLPVRDVQSSAIDVKQLPRHGLRSIFKGDEVQVVEIGNLPLLSREHILRCITIPANRHGLGHTEKGLVALRVALRLPYGQCAHRALGSSLRFKSSLAFFPLARQKILPRDVFDVPERQSGSIKFRRLQKTTPAIRRDNNNNARTALPFARGEAINRS